MSREKISALNTLGKEEIALLINGLTSLKGALSALDETLPRSFERLSLLLGEEMKKFDRAPDGLMTTKQVSALLECHERYVAMLCEKGKITRATPGERGRGRSAMYHRDSVEAYKAKRRQDPTLLS